MSPTLQRRKASQFILLVLLAILVLSLAMVSSAGAEGAPYKEVPGYPKYGCYDVVIGGHGMWGGVTPYPLSADVPGPVVDAYLVWIGTEDLGAPNSPAQSDLLVNGVTVIGDQVDQKVLGDPSVEPAPWYMWRADVGPSGANLITQGFNKLYLSGWEFFAVNNTRRNGVSLVVVYSTGACERPNQIDLFDSMDYYYAWRPDEGTTGPMTITFPPAPVDREVAFFLNHAGTDHVYQCREEAVWAAVGSGTPPTSIVYDWAFPAQGMNGGKRVIQNAFNPATCGNTSWAAPLTSMWGWEPGYGWKPGVGGFIYDEWSFIKATIHVPAGATYVVLQGESVKEVAPSAGVAAPDNLDENAVNGQSLPGESGAWFGQFSTPLYNPELKVTKTDGVTDAAPGDTLTYTIDFENYGYGAAENVTITDKLPDFVSYVSATNGGVFDSATRTVTWKAGTLDIGKKGQVAVTVKLDPAFEAGTTTLTNEVTISTITPGELDPSDNKATDTTNVFAEVELSIAKKAVPEPVDAGANLTYTVDWTVGGNAYSHDVKIVDMLPAGVTFVSASNGGVHNPGAGTVTWALGDVTPVETGSFTVVVNVNSPQYNGVKLTNDVAITNNAGDKAEASVISTVRSSHTLLIDKTAAPEPVDAGTDLTYTINWEVTGNEPAKDAMVVDTLPALVTFVSASDGGVYDPATRTITWDLGEVMTPESGSLTVVVNVPSPQYNGTQFTNEVDFSDMTPGSEPVSDTVISTVRADHELSVTKEDSPDPVAKGAELTYTIAWKVTGNEPADGVVLTDPIPFGTRFVSASDGGAYDVATNTVTWSVGNKVPGDAGSVTLVVKVNEDFINGLVVENRVTITSDKPGKEKHGDATTEVIQTPEGSIGDTVWIDVNGNGIQEPGEPGIGGVDLTLYDAGADGKCSTGDDQLIASTTTDANGKYRFDKVDAGVYCVDVMNATLPAGLTLVSGTDPNGPITLAEGQNYKDADFGYQADAGKGVIGDRVWSDANGNGAQDPGEVGLGGVNLALSRVGADGICGTADDVVVANTTSAADGSYLFTGLAPDTYCVKATDPAGATLTGGANPHGPIVLGAGQIYLDADFGYKTPVSGQIGNLVFYDGNRNGVYDGSPLDHGIGGVTLSLVAAGADGELGTADDVTIATTTTAADGSYLFSGLADGAYRVVVTDLSGRLEGYTQTFGVPNTDNNSQSSPFSVTIAGGSSVLYADFGYADGHLLSVTKVNNVPAGKPVEAGAEMVYTIAYSVTGREPAPNVMLTDPLPMQLDFIEASNGGTYDPVTRLVSWSLGTLEPGATGSVTLKVRVKKPLPNNSYIFNTVTIIDDAKVRDEATDVIRVHAEPILSLTKTNLPTGEVKPGDVIKYTMCFANTGNGNATGVVLTDVIPTNTTYVAGSATGGGVVYNEATKTLTWNVGLLEIELTKCVTFEVTVNMTVEGLTGQAGVMTFAQWNSLSITNTAVLKCNEVGDKTATVVNPLVATVDPKIYKTVNEPIRHVGETIVFTVKVTNEGTANATDVVVTDMIHPMLVEVTVSSSKGTTSYDPATRGWTVNVGVLAPQETVTVTITGKAASGKTPYQITNSAVVGFKEGESRQSNIVTVDVVSFPSDIPEPGTWLLLGSGLAGLAGYARTRTRARRRKQ